MMQGLFFDKESSLERAMMEEGFLSSQFTESEGIRWYQQVKLGLYGVCDIVGVREGINDDGEPLLDVVLLELKNTDFVLKHIAQCARYKMFFENYVSRVGCDLYFSAMLINTFGDKKGDYDFSALVSSLPWLDTGVLRMNMGEGAYIHTYSGCSNEVENTHVEGFNTSVEIPVVFQEACKAAFNKTAKSGGKL